MSPWRQALARRAYAVVLGLLIPAYLAKLWWRGRAEPLYRHAVRERLGFYGSQVALPGAVWVHAVSLGETRAAASLIDQLRHRHPGMRLLLTHSTATGREAGRLLLRPGDEQAWLPFDAPAAVARFLDHFRPTIGVLMETEVWPELLLQARAQSIPMVLANARLSERSERKGRRFDTLLRPAVQSLRLVLAQTTDDARRLRVAGAPTVVVAGNLKFDMTPSPALMAQGQAWHERLQRPVVLGAATREGEEALLLDAWQALRAKSASQSQPLLLIVPRHPQRFDEVAHLIQAAGLTLSRRSAWSGAPEDAACASDVWLGDSLGEMPLYYAAADVALLGGSFAPLGGQNLIEAAACGCPLVMGPHTFNFDDAASLALAAGAAFRVSDMSAGVHEALALLNSIPRREHASQQARAFTAQHHGAAARMAQAISEVLANKSP